MPTCWTHRVALGALALTLALPGSARAAGPEIVPADIKALMGEVRKPGAKAVLVNVWATWCDPCIEEMPDILRFFRDHRDKGLRLVLVSGDDEETRAKAEKFLASQGVDFRSFLKAGDDMDFINGLAQDWSGSLPASFLYDANGKRHHFWSGKVSYDALSAKLAEVLAVKPKQKLPQRRRRP